ncbi:MAG: hypothetical protein ACP5HU_10970 [Phycisphaerae bacterium]
MQHFCTDRDLLGIEPSMFLGGGFPASSLVAGEDGQLSGTSFTSAGSDFPAGGVQAGMVLTAYGAVPAEGAALEIVSVDSATELTVSVLRGAADDEPIAPPAGAGGKFFVRSYRLQIARVSAALAEKLRRLTEAPGITAAEFADSSQLTAVTCYGVLAECFTARSAGGDAGDANWIKARHYRELYSGGQLQLRLAVDADGDGFAEQTRTLGNVRLRRT